MKKYLLIFTLFLIVTPVFSFENIVTVKAATPEIFSFSYGMFFDLVPEQEKDDQQHADFRPQVYNQYSSGVILEFEASLGGGKINFGAHSYIICGGSLKASVFKTWGDPVFLDPGQLYAGVELDFRFYPFIGCVGVYRHIHGDDSDPLTISTVGIGLWYTF